MNKIYEPFLRLFIDIFIHYVHTNNRLSILAGNISYKTERNRRTVFPEYFVVITLQIVIQFYKLKQIKDQTLRFQQDWLLTRGVSDECVQFC